ncbi:MAG: hypothetical protein OJJ21_05215 [Ferrovibrio sp.]|uniref:DUF6622 family protein n=1 Tax=Ferrovibrio sp. TaxID=1917215 RepID=UPI00261597F4|nr:DUF6622 family protein [Ferrovibrio sp.]MCW0232981.1 hypothetical protein [Ferrovibrio sp.]
MPAIAAAASLPRMIAILSYAAGILSHTPLWVWALLALLAWLGSLGLRQRRMTLRRIAIVPAIFILWGLAGLVARPFDPDTIAALWLGGLAGGLLLGLATGPRILSADRLRGRVELPASWWPLLRNLIIFFAHYALTVTAILTAHRVVLIQADIVVSGGSAGYFIGWGLALWRRYRSVADTATASAG